MKLGGTVQPEEMGQMFENGDKTSTKKLGNLNPDLAKFINNQELLFDSSNRLQEKKSSLLKGDAEEHLDGLIRKNVSYRKYLERRARIAYATFYYLVFNSCKSSTVRYAQFWGGVYLFLFYFFPMIMGACLAPLHCVWNPNKIYTVKLY